MTVCLPNEYGVRSQAPIIIPTVVITLVFHCGLWTWLPFRRYSIWGDRCSRPGTAVGNILDLLNKVTGESFGDLGWAVQLYSLVSICKITWCAGVLIVRHPKDSYRARTLLTLPGGTTFASASHAFSLQLQPLRCQYYSASRRGHHHALPALARHLRVERQQQSSTQAKRENDCTVGLAAFFLRRLSPKTRLPV